MRMVDIVFHKGKFISAAPSGTKWKDELVNNDFYIFKNKEIPEELKVGYIHPVMYQGKIHNITAEQLGFNPLEIGEE